MPGQFLPFSEYSRPSLWFWTFFPVIPFGFAVWLCSVVSFKAGKQAVGIMIVFPIIFLLIVAPWVLRAAGCIRELRKRSMDDKKDMVCDRNPAPDSQRSKADLIVGFIWISVWAVVMFGFILSLFIRWGFRGPGAVILLIVLLTCEIPAVVELWRLFAEFRRRRRDRS